MPYSYPGFAKVVLIQEEAGKRYSLEVELDLAGPDTWLIIQKNPSKANAGNSDHTINRVLNYIHKNQDRYPVLSQVGKVVFLNLIPWYETYSNQLIHKGKTLIDPQNIRTIGKYLSGQNPCIIAWGNPAAGLTQIHESLSREAWERMRQHENPVYHVGSLTRLKFPRHGQIWGYSDPLISIIP